MSASQAARAAQANQPSPANPAFPPPAGLSAEMANGWNFYASSPEFKSIKLIQLTPAVRASNSITLNVEGKTFVINGTSKRIEGSQKSSRGVVTGKSPGGVVWDSEVIGKDGQGHLYFSDDGFIVGDFELRGLGNFKIRGRDGVAFLVGWDSSKGPQNQPPVQEEPLPPTPPTIKK